jgi:hypothetical protein
MAEVCGGWMVNGEIRILLAWPNADNPEQLFNERLSEVLNLMNE